LFVLFVQNNTPKEKSVHILRNILPQFHHFRMVPKEFQVSHYSFQNIPTTVATLVVLEQTMRGKMIFWSIENKMLLT